MKQNKWMPACMVCTLWLGACSSDTEPASAMTAMPGSVDGAAAAGTAPVDAMQMVADGTGTVGTSAGDDPTMVPATAAPPAIPAMGPATMGPAMGTGGGMAGPMQGAEDSGADDGMSSVPSAPMPATGPKDGDPNAPLVELEDVPCRSESELTGLSFGGINATIEGRELALDYPCGKHEGAHMTVILNLHGTLISGAPFLYQRGYFSAHRYAHSHNLIVITPQSASQTSAGAQWGRDDGGADIPYLNALMTWVYEKFEKFNIRSTWVGGHSWGAFFAAGGFSMPGYVCNEMFQDKFKGVIGMSRLSTPTCADRIAMIATRGEEEGISLLDQSQVAAAHGCQGEMKGPEMLGNNERYYYEGCNPGFVHEDYNMLGKGHIDSMDQEVVLKIVEQIKSTEP